MRVLLASEPRSGDESAVTGRSRRWCLQHLDDAGEAIGPPSYPAAGSGDDSGDDSGDSGEGSGEFGALAAAVRAREAERSPEAGAAPRWVWASTGSLYPRLLAAGVRVDRCHDVALTEALLRAHEGRPAPNPADGDGDGPPAAQRSLFDVPAAVPGAADPAAVADAGDHNSIDPGAGPTTPAQLSKVFADQLARIEIARSISPGFPLLVAAESAAALAASEMGHVGLPWRADVHDLVLTGLLGERPKHGGRPPKLQELADTIARSLDAAPRGGAAQLNVDSPLEILRAFRRQGVLLQTTRARELKTVDHPAIPPLLQYKELARLHVAHGWAWRDQWVADGRFKPEYVPGGVVSGRWATKGGGALQIPKAMRSAVVADPGWALVVADAGQLEPRILAALSGDPGMVAATRDGDLYAALARQALGRPEARGEAKIALLAAMYGARANTPAMAALRRRFPSALELLEVAARTGEDGGIVRSALGRTCPPPDPSWQQGPEAVALARSRARGRFTRNFVIQASAADWANVLVAGLRRRLTALSRPELVLFQHDEVVVHAPQSMVEAVVTAIAESGAEATRLVVGERGVHIPLTGVSVASYADKA